MNFTKVRLNLLLLFISYLAISCSITSKSRNNQNETYSFLVAGHVYGYPGAKNIGVHPPFKKKIKLIKKDKNIKFGIFTGDIVEYAKPNYWDGIDSDIEKLGIPVHFAVGNHDVGRSHKRKLYESRYGSTYYNFTYNDDLFIILDPNLDHWNISGLQLEFLKKVIKKNRNSKNNIFVFFHQVLWWEENNIYKNVNLNSKSGRADSINFWTEVEPLFRKTKNNVYMFAGDVGVFPKKNANSDIMYHNFDNITLIASGMGSGFRDNIIIVDINPDRTISFRLIALNGKNVDSLGKLEDYILK